MEYIAYTGTPSRYETLPRVIISSTDCCSGKIGEKLGSPRNVSSNNAWKLEPGNENDDDTLHTSRCVYKYGEHGNFDRIKREDDLVLDSNFESGNLLKAFRLDHSKTVHHPIKFQEYNLYLHHDVHSKGHTQWFYYTCSNTSAGNVVKFNIVNFVKRASLFNHGMRPLVLSRKGENKWVRAGYDISYFPSKHRKGKKQLYTLTFTYKFLHSSDICLFAYGYPYTYTDLQEYLDNLQTQIADKPFFRRNILCKTLAGNLCDVLTITEPTSSLDGLKRKLCVVITARVHPGETNASWICKGIIDFLTSDSTEALTLRSLFVFKIIPMLNPDGVINGNYRTSMAGVDLNRRWNNPSSEFHPTIYNTKVMIKRLKKVIDVVTVCDIHGTS